MTAIEEAREALAYLTASMDGRPGDGSPTLGQSVPRAETALRALIAEHERVSEERDRWKVEYERSEAARQVALKGARRLSVPPSDDEREAMSDLDTARSEALMDAADDDALVEELVDAVMCVDEEPFETWRYRMEAAIKKVLRRQGPPSDDEREALVDLRLATYPKLMSDGYSSIIVRGNEEAADIVLAAGFRRQGPITDEAVEAALSAFWTAIDDDPVIDPGDLPAMRAALEVAERVRSAVPSTTEPSSSAFSGGGAGYGKADYPEESS